jgi:ubiquinol-cytochrome c reductase cytochrome b subunit
LDKKVPAGIGFSRALGPGLLVLIVVQAVTGMLLGLAYAPTPDHAYDSIRYIDEDVRAGRLLRGLHHWGSSAVVVLAIAHLVRVVVTGAYKRPRRGLWVVGVGLLLVLLGFSFTGYLLPWDQKAYWATDVGLNIAESVPVGGEFLAQLLRGGAEIGALTLTRMFALHVLFLPAALAALLALHLFLVHHLGITPPRARVGEREVRTEPFYPDHVARELLVAGAALLVVLAMALLFGPPLEAPADRDAHGYDPRPEWYFLGLFQLLKYFEGDAMIWGTAVLPGGLLLGLLLLPFLDRSRERNLRRRPVVLVVGGVVMLGGAGLTVLGALDPGSKSQPPPRVLESSDGYQPPPSPSFQEPRGIPPDPLQPEPEQDPKVIALDRITLYECTFCHTLEGEGDDLGAGGPPLEETARGRDADWLHAFLQDPKSEYPDTDMPSAAELDMSTEDREILVNFLLELALEDS